MNRTYLCRLLPSQLILLLTLLHLLPAAVSIQCYSGSQLQVIECPAISCIKQTLGMDTVRYCDGTGVSSICQTYQIFETCETIPDLGFICCCSGDLCNSTTYNTYSMTVILATLFVAIWNIL